MLLAPWSMRSQARYNGPRIWTSSGRLFRRRPTFLSAICGRLWMLDRPYRTYSLSHHLCAVWNTTDGNISKQAISSFKNISPPARWILAANKILYVIDFIDLNLYLKILRYAKPLIFNVFYTSGNFRYDKELATLHPWFSCERYTLVRYTHLQQSIHSLQYDCQIMLLQSI